MASVFKARGKAHYTILYVDENGRRRKKAGATDKVVTERIAHDLENKVALHKQGLIDPKAESFRDHEARPLEQHIAEWQADIVARGHTIRHAEHTANRVRRLVAVVLGASAAPREYQHLAPRDRGTITPKIVAMLAPARLSVLTRQRVQDALARFQATGSSLQTCNHYRGAMKTFSRWLYNADRMREDSLHGLKGFNAKEDPRHDRRTIALDELRRLIEAAHCGPEVMSMPGPSRAICYRLAVATGLRHAEISSILPESFDWKAPSVTVAAAYTKNGDPATLPLPNDLADDLAAYVSPLPLGTPVFHLSPERGARMLRVDLKAAGIPYRDASGLVFDFHSLRCEMATLADAAGVTPRVVQKMMRHSSLELTGRYTRPRAVDIDAAAEMLPSLKPAGNPSEREVMTGTDSGPVSLSNATQNATKANAYACNQLGRHAVASNEQRTFHPQSASGCAGGDGHRRTPLR
jgi:integrase